MFIIISITYKRHGIEMVFKEIAEIERRKIVDKQWDLIRNDKGLSLEFAINDFINENTQFKSIFDIQIQACQKFLGHSNFAELNHKDIDKFVKENTEFESLKEIEIQTRNYLSKQN
ncbi:hypothetical protein F909_03878 [Acinetobacter sp. ANC 3929]|uniref:hypothetical protein n=1 Tax=Acinetobacter sp. ANC 3929 TaxID=1217707 RepID=UPI0002CFC587|nr:hypothetical protein [Acinetobacter sp. ANC 3929]ENW78192.1 hypothetical protein F909_03878 [Acinetobacter sp. ANC 3929]